VDIRVAQEHEIDDIVDLLLASYDEFTPPKGDPLEASWVEYRAEIADVKSRWAIAEHLIAADGDTIIATATFFPDASKIDGEDAWPEGYASMRLLGVHPSQRGRGAGARLTRECIDRARAAGREWLGLHTTRLMEVAQAMYERMGFTRFPENDIPITDDFIVVAYRLPLL
jgi:GNAT superfamily N-acetyltransferase